jgi:hypothetical protein
LLVNEWPSLEVDFADFNTPQYLAYDWLAKNPDLAEYSEQRIIQRFSLATLYFSTGGENWRRNDRWLSDENECLWYSTSSTLPCDEMLAYTSLELELNNLAGTIPSEMALLSNSLTRISFSSRDRVGLTGSIPAELGFLRFLEIVNLAGNALTGTLPDAIGKWNSVQSIDFSSNQLSGSLSYSLVYWQSLSSLDLSQNDFTGPIPSELGLLTMLQVLHLEENRLKTLPTEIGQLLLLQQLLASDNEIGSLPSEIGRLINLLDLNLSQNVMAGMYAFSVCLTITTQECLSDLHGNSLFAGSIPSELGNLLSIRDQLNLANNLLTGPLPEELGRLIFLRNLLLQSNALTGTVPVSFAKLDRLNSLRLEDNDLSGTVPDEVCAVYSQTFPIFVTDCLDGEIDCDCCMFCCENGGGCECEFANTQLSFLCAEFTESPGLEERISGSAL